MPDANGLYCETHGPEDAPAVILSPGLGGSGSYWQPNIAALAAEHHVILYDHRGTGRSDRTLPEHVTVEDLARDMLALMDRLGIASASVIGHAAGGVAGLALAEIAPDRLDRLIVVNGWASADPHFLRCFEARLALLRASGIDAFLRAQPIFLFPANWISTHSQELDAELAHQAANFPGPETMEKRIAALAAFDMRGQLAGLRDKVLVLLSEDDMLVPSRAGHLLAEELGGAPVAAMPWGGHACNVTDPENFNRIVLDFLRS